MGACVTDPTPLTGEAEQLLRYGHTQQLRVGQLGLGTRQMITTPTQRGQDTIVELDVECGQEGVQVVRHKMIFDALRLPPPAATRA